MAAFSARTRSKTSPSAAAVFRSSSQCCLNVVARLLAGARRVRRARVPGRQAVEPRQEIGQPRDASSACAIAAPGELQLLAVVRTESSR